jgi:hypothetical protein
MSKILDRTIIECKHNSMQADYHGYGRGKIGHCIHCGKSFSYLVKENGGHEIIAEVSFNIIGVKK